MRKIFFIAAIQVAASRPLPRGRSGESGQAEPDDRLDLRREVRRPQRQRVGVRRRCRVRLTMQHARESKRAEPESGLLEELAARRKCEVVEWVGVKHEDLLGGSRHHRPCVGGTKIGNYDAIPIRTSPPPSLSR